jgi:hypothetical protein
MVEPAYLSQVTPLVLQPFIYILGKQLGCGQERDGCLQDPVQNEGMK